MTCRGPARRTCRRTFCSATRAEDLAEAGDAELALDVRTVGSDFDDGHSELPAQREGECDSVRYRGGAQELVAGGAERQVGAHDERLVKLMNALVGPSQNWMDIRKGPEQTTLNESTFGGRSSLNNQKMAYAREVYEYNKLINEGAMRPSLVQRDIWEIMKYMPSVKPSPRTKDPLRARCTQTQFIEQAKRYLENRYKLFMQTVIAEHLRDAQRGGISSILNLVG
ncbi:hypothetical protein pipiens_012592 [Culex pipiens pipiens]|uniref:Nuclear pore protein n=1 Tax=Culex pipiens pipiens TaxID=38569 RepID=A0ABD1D1P4_CULPP